MKKMFGETLRKMRKAHGTGLCVAADKLGISPAYLSRIELARENPPRPELIRKMATTFGGDADALFRLAQSTDPVLADYMNSTPALPKFLRAAMSARFTSKDFEHLTEQVRRQKSARTSR